MSIYSPHDESLVADGFQVASEADVDKAVSAARAAFKGEWSKWTPQQRSEAMVKFADLTDKHAEELALWETKSMGQPINIAKFIYALFGKIFRYYAGWTDKLPGEAWTEDEQGMYKVFSHLGSIEDNYLTTAIDRSVRSCWRLRWNRCLEWFEE